MFNALQRAEKLFDRLPETSDEGGAVRVVSRRGLLAGAGGAAVVLAGCGESSTSSTTAAAPAAAEPPAAGLAGGPTGFKGAERYQYAADSAPGRAVGAAKRLKAEGKAPETLVVGLYTGSIGSYEKPFPEGAESPAQLWEEATGIKVKFVGVDPADAYSKATRMAATQDGTQHIVQLGMADTGDLAEAGLLLDLAEYVEKYKPDWDDASYGYLGGEPTTKYLNYYNGKPYAVASDGDFQVYFTRSDLFDDKREQSGFESKYGYALKAPDTWDQAKDIAEWFHRPDKGLFGSTELRGPAWGWINFIQRYVSTSDPVQFYFDDDMKPLLVSDQGLRAMNSYVDMVRLGSPDSVSWIWEQQYANWGKAGAAQTTGFSNLRKFIRKGSQLDQANVGVRTRPSPIPGFEVDGKVVRHTSLYFNASNGVNKFSDSKYHELSYVFLQWLASGPIYTWVSANPGGYQDPCKKSCIEDELVRDSYTPETMDVLKVSVPGSVPSPSSLKGAPAYIQALDLNLQKAITKQSSPEQTLEAISRAWDETTDKVGRENQAAAWRASKAGWPTTADSTQA